MNLKLLLVSLIFILLTLQSNYADVLKMLKIFGKVQDSDLKDAKSDENCTQTCFSDSDCILAFFDVNSKCLLFLYNSTETLQVEETNRDDGLFVAFKTNLPTSDLEYCPQESEISPNIFLGEDTTSWTKTSDSTWQFKKCVGNWKMFKRTDPNITDYCSSMEKQVTGVATVKESIWILWLAPRTWFIRRNWIDGERKTPEMNNFTWTDGYTEGYGAFESGNGWIGFKDGKKVPENCLVVSRTQGRYSRINDVICGIGTGKELGVACGYKLE